MIVINENEILSHACNEHFINQEELSFYKKLLEYRRKREEFYRRVREEVNDPEVQAMYRDPEFNLDL